MRSLQLLRLFVLGILLTLGTSAVHAQAPRLSAQDAKAIDTTLNLVGTSLTNMDFDTFGTLFTDDCDFVNVVGMHWVGKAQVVQAHRVVFTTRYHGFPQHITEELPALIAPDVALVTTTVKMDDYTAQDGKRMVDNYSRLTWVLVKRDGRWLIRSGQNTTIDLEAAKHHPELVTARPTHLP